MKLNQIAMHRQMIPEDCLEDGFLRKDVSVIVAFIEGNEKIRKEKFDKIRHYCNLLRKVVI